MATSEEYLSQYFEVLEETLRQNGIFNNPIRIYNCDEKGIPPRDVKVVNKRGTKNVNCISGEDKTQITVLACTSASVTALSPTVIFDRKTLKSDLTTGEVPGTVYWLSEKGWINRNCS